MEEQQTRNTPINDLDLQMMTIDTAWGKEISPELKKVLVETGNLETDKDGKVIIGQKHLWGILSYYSRDMRLGNLDNQTYIVACEWLDFAGDMVRLGLVKSFLTSLSRVVTMLELSQSKGGFLRKRLGTFTQEHYNEFKDGEKKGGLFSKKKENNGGF